MKTTILRSVSILKGSFLVSIFTVLLFTGRKDSDDASTQSGIILQEATAPGEMLEGPGDNSQDCVKIYEMQGDDISITEKEMMLLDCLVETTHAQIKSESFDPYVLVNVSVRGGIDESFEFENMEFNARNEYDVVVPFNLDNDRSILFQTGLDVYVHVSDLLNGEDASVDSGFGRFFGGSMIRFSVGNGVIGINTFWDTTQQARFDLAQNWHHRISAGFDYADDYNRVSVNYYHPLSGWIDIDNYRRERAMGGFDARYERAIGIVDLYLQGEFFFTGHDFALFADLDENGGAQAAVGIGLGVNFNCATRASTGIDVMKNDLNLSNVNLENLNLGLTLGLRQFIGRDCKNLKHRRAERSRNINVVSEEDR